MKNTSRFHSLSARIMLLIEIVSVAAAKLSKSAKGRLGSIKAPTSGTATSGLATSLAFTPVQGESLLQRVIG